MAIIQVKPEWLRGQAREVRNIKKDHVGTMDKITNLVHGLHDQWQGAAQDAFLEKYNDFEERTFKQFEQMLEDYAKLMEKAAEQLEQEDTSLSNKEMRTFTNFS